MPYRGKKDGFQSGMIVMWSGLLSNVPAGWSVCDGTNGTPNLRNKFIRGASAEVGSEGGVCTHSHTLLGCTGCESGCTLMINSGSMYPVPVLGHIHPAGDLSESDETNLPPFYELIFIRKD